MKPIEFIYEQKSGLLVDLIIAIGVPTIRELEWSGFIVLDDIDRWEITVLGIKKYEEITFLRFT